MTAPRRARSEAAKLERREHILATALELWANHTFASFTMAEVAARSGLAKGTLYLYFATKEELLLALLEAQLKGWFDAVDGGLSEEGQWDVERAAALICAALRRQAALVGLLPIAASILEHNIPLETARAYKTLLLERSTHTGGLFEARLPFLAPGDGLWLLLQVYALIVGLGQMAAPAPVVAQLLEEASMAPLRVVFEPAFSRSITALLRGAAGASPAANHEKAMKESR